MSANNSRDSKRVPTRIKRIPEHSYSIILKFQNKKDRDECINSEDFKAIFGEMATVLINYNIRMETIKWDVITGKKKNNKKD